MSLRLYLRALADWEASRDCCCRRTGDASAVRGVEALGFGRKARVLVVERMLERHDGQCRAGRAMVGDVGVEEVIFFLARLTVEMEILRSSEFGDASDNPLESSVKRNKHSHHHLHHLHLSNKMFLTSEVRTAVKPRP